MTKKLTDDFMEVMKEFYFNKIFWNLSEFLQGEMKVLTFIRHGEKDMLPGEIAAELNMTGGRIAGILRSLEKKGYIIRKTYDKDRRKVLVNITENGEAYVDKGTAALRRSIEELIRQMGNEETAALIMSLQKLTEAAKKWEKNSKEEL